jgi:glutathione synthase/RimK-type ligase-like ATP-grasp enzyme
MPPTERPRVLLATARGSWELDRDADALLDSLLRVGVEASPAVWDDPGVAWSDADLVVVRSTWDYTERLDAFLDWARQVEAATDLANPVDVLRWTTDKRYLQDLAAAGVPVVTGRFLDPGADEVDIEATVLGVLDGAASGEVVVKPTVSAGSKDTLRVGSEDARAGLDLARRLCTAGRSVVVQPYLPSVDARGETGVVHFGGNHSHAFTKGAILRRGAGLVDGPFAPEHITPARASRAELDVADAAIAVAARHATIPLLYARVDLVHDDHGDPVVLELELCEPSFFVEVDPAAAGRFARAIVDRLDQAGTATSRNSTVPSSRTDSPGG